MAKLEATKGCAVLDAVDLLEVLGADADLAKSEDLNRVLQREGVDPALRAALLDGNDETLRRLLRAPDTVCCLIDPAEEEDEEEEEEEREDDEDDIEPKGPKPPASSPRRLE